MLGLHRKDRGQRDTAVRPSIAVDADGEAAAKDVRAEDEEVVRPPRNV